MSDSWEEFETDENAGITELLDRAYDLLDDYRGWAERFESKEDRQIEQDTYNIEALLDFLANSHNKPIESINEYQLRWFLHSHYIRKSIADAETEDRLPASLSAFARFLRSDQSITLPDWYDVILQDQELYHTRRNAYRALSSDDEASWQVGFRTWCEELNEDLDAHCLLIPAEVTPGVLWGSSMGWREAALYSEAIDRWQDERSELLLQGLSFDQIRDVLRLSYFEWMDTEQARLDGKSPSEVILSEREEREEQASEDAEDDSSADMPGFI